MKRNLIVLAFVLLAHIAGAQKYVAPSSSQRFKVVEHSRLARFISWINGGTSEYAITFAKTIYITCSKDVFFGRPWWVKHELTHVKQYEKYGVTGFLQMYLVYSLFHGYAGNPLETTAVTAENASN